MHMQSYLFINVAYMFKHVHMHACAHTHTHKYIYMFNLSTDNESTNAKVVLAQSTEKKTHLILGKKKKYSYTLK